MENKFQYRVKDVDYDVEIEEIEGNVARVTVNGIPFEVEMKEPIKAQPQAHKVQRVDRPAAAPAAAAPAAAPSKPAQAAGAGRKVVAPLPGTISEVKVKVGDVVKEGETVIVLEAMKMQNNIGAECSGTITSVLVNQGETVMEGATLVTIE